MRSCTCDFVDLAGVCNACHSVQRGQSARDEEETCKWISVMNRAWLWRANHAFKAPHNVSLCHYGPATGPQCQPSIRLCTTYSTELAHLNRPCATATPAENTRLARRHLSNRMCSHLLQSLALLGALGPLLRLPCGHQILILRHVLGRQLKPRGVTAQHGGRRRLRAGST